MINIVSPDGQIYAIHPDLASRHIDQLVGYTQEDPEIHTNTADWKTQDGQPGRFSSKEAYTTWNAQGKTVYSLIDSEKNLAGIVWFTPKIISLGKYKITQTEQQKYQTTLGIRLYGRARGHKLAKPFLRSAIKEYLKLLDKRELYLWLEVHEDNVRAQHLYESMGFRQTAKSADNSQVLLLTQVSGKL